MMASGRSSSEEDMTIDVKELFNGLDTRIGFAKAVPELNDLERREEFSKVWLGVGGIFTIESSEQHRMETTGTRDNCGGWRVDEGLLNL